MSETKLESVKPSRRKMIQCFEANQIMKEVPYKINWINSIIWLNIWSVFSKKSFSWVTFVNQFKLYLFYFISKQILMSPNFLPKYILHNIIPVLYYVRNCCYVSDFIVIFLLICRKAHTSDQIQLKTAYNRRYTPEGMALKTSADTGILYFCKKSE